MKTEYEYSTSRHDVSHAHLFPTVDLLLRGVAPESTVLDLGCGNGSFISLFHNRGWKCFGVDSSVTGIEIAQKSYPGVHFFRADVEHAESEILKQVGQLDTIISTEVIEHVYAPRDFLKTSYALLKPGGLLVITTPYHGYLKNLMLAVTGKLDNHFTVLWDNGHIKFWSRDTLTQVTREAGFKPVGFRGSGRLPYLWNSMALVVQKPFEEPLSR
jgi:2-polyprenyl-6-hydroxyphenyl methylase/3-demethylubiquinone-9 3-methyltransferase